jgi:hypothetical protein
MYQKDYILRIIEQIGILIRGILGLIENGNLEEAREKLDDLYYETLKEDAAFFTLIPAEKLTQKLLTDHNYTNGHLEILAELLNVEAELAFAKGNRTGSLEYSRKSLTLLAFLDEAYKTYSKERLDKMNMIRERIKELSKS